MILIDNLNFLTERFPQLWQAIKPLEGKVFPALEVTTARNGMPTLKVEKDGKSLYLHSSYNPEAEAERFVDQFTGVEKYRHVFFFGVGLGYHVEAFMRKYPNLGFTIYEPVPEILVTYLASRPLANLPLKQLKNFYVEMEPSNRPILLQNFTDFSDGNVLFVALPSYEQAFPELTKEFLASFQRTLAAKRFNLNANATYQRKWTINSIRNFKHLLTTPNILREKDRFQGIPALIVAAGPSLLDEIENLRLIKEKGLAYIFSAGSGLVPLLNNGIYPDAATSYDPNRFDGVYQQVYEKQITEIPLIFGSTVGISIDKYPGPKAHMINSLDTVAPYYLRLKDGAELQTFHDSSTVSVVLVQLLKHLGFDPVIFVGQNLAFRGEYRYAGGIPYYKPEVTEKWRKKAILTEAVDGGQVYTLEDYNQMRSELERVITHHPEAEFINTTKGGAKIAGTTFIPLEQVIAERLTRRVVEPGWFPAATCEYDGEYLQQQHKKMEAEYRSLPETISRLTKAFSALERLGPGGEQCSTPQTD
ncbi:motility associated factor glycosyltransferase family protein [Capillibacterium thermochitinicola]|uniref:Motility associated factor glycosyltransferase family protein n=1 Tax=Capillibacterium thermochitinicola TaxID=2699427 RepID=A0A8J6LRN7_9FIRM|nr:6-hydroxymethylpterin diphosphokinase MptE-like protein [Capillibacterium thermochitinicola]MBA2132317.1 motility associated factor glycosyltransferase family protein [Capillibacterium thermochitinicola]